MRLDDPAVLSPFLRRHGLVAAKSFGQHFLCSKIVVDAILRRVEGYASALEIGPGPGILTSPLCELLAKVIAFEVDDRMLPLLAESSPRVDLRREDALQADLREALSSLQEPRAIVSNLPYYITGPLIGRIIDCKDLIGKAVLMMQREVAEKILAPIGDSNRGSLSVHMQALFEIEKVVVAPPGAFMPPPKVTSVVLELRPRLGVSYPDGLFGFVKGGFVQPRKTLSNNIRSENQIDRDTLERIFAQLGLDDRARPHTLSLETWLNLYELLRPHQSRQI